MYTLQARRPPCIFEELSFCHWALVWIVPTGCDSIVWVNVAAMEWPITHQTGGFNRHKHRLFALDTLVMLLWETHFGEKQTNKSYSFFEAWWLRVKRVGSCQWITNRITDTLIPDNKRFWKTSIRVIYSIDHQLLLLFSSSSTSPWITPFMVQWQ